MKKSRRDFLKKAAAAGLAIETSMLLGPQSLLASQGQRDLEDLASLSKSGSDQEFWERVRTSFRLPENPIYFNNAGLGATANIVIDKLIEQSISLEERITSGHNNLKEYRQDFANYFNCDSSDLCFTRNATEGMNFVANGLCLKKSDEVLLTTHEHVGATIPWTMATNKAGAELKLVDLDLSGTENFNKITSAVTKKTKIIVCSHVTCTTGMVLPIAELSAWCKEQEILFCVDGAQSAGMMVVDLSKINPDFYVTSGHKWLFGPKGTGVFYARKEAMSQLTGGPVGAYSDHSYNLEERIFEPHPTAGRFEYGTRNSAVYASLAEAVKFISEIGQDRIAERGKQLASILTDRISEKVTILSPAEDQFRSSIVTFRIGDRPYRNLQDSLQANRKFKVRGIYENNLNAIRISCACYNNEEQISLLADHINELAAG